MGKLFNDDGTVNEIELDGLVYELEETQRLRDLEIERREIRIEEIDQEIDMLKSGMEKIKMLDDEYLPTSVADILMHTSIRISIENNVNNKIGDLLREKEALTNKYTI